MESQISENESWIKGPVVRRRVIVAMMLLAVPLIVATILSIQFYKAEARNVRFVVALDQLNNRLSALHIGLLSYKIPDPLERASVLQHIDFYERYSNTLRVYTAFRLIDPDKISRNPEDITVIGNKLSKLAARLGIRPAVEARLLGILGDEMPLELSRVWEENPNLADLPIDIIRTRSLEFIVGSVLLELEPLVLQMTPITETILALYQKRNSPKFANVSLRLRAVNEKVRENAVNFGYRPMLISLGILALTLLAELVAYFAVLRPLINGIVNTQAILQRSERQLSQSRKQEALGRLVSGVAHDFNNILGTIMTNSELVGDGRLSKSKAELNLEIQRAVRRGSSLSRQLLAFGRQAPLDAKTINLHEVLNDAGTLFKRTLPSTIKIDVQVSSDVYPIKIDQSHFESALLNLVINARDAMPEGGQLGIFAHNVTESDTNAVEIIIQDNGEGMSSDVQQRAFDPFFTTKQTGKGAGLGLSMVDGFVRQSSGKIFLESSPGEGTTVSIVFPAAERKEYNKRLPSKKPQADSFCGQTILLVEDQTSLRVAMTKLLEGTGFKVIAADTGDKAAEILTKKPELDLIVTDITMPGVVQGDDLGPLVRELKMDIPIILVTGNEAYLSKNITAHATVLRKPVAAAELLDAVAEHLKKQQ